VLSSIESLQRVQMEDSQIQLFKTNLVNTRLRIQGLMNTASSGAIWRLNQMIKSHEQAVIAQRGA